MINKFSENNQEDIHLADVTSYRLDDHSPRHLVHGGPAAQLSSYFIGSTISLTRQKAAEA
jgi:hypothetical protein